MVEQTKNGNSESPDWQQLQKVWQDTPSVDMAKLARNARFVWWRMRLNFGLEIVFSGVGFAIFASFIDLKSLPSTVFGSIGILFSVISFWAAFYIRRGVWDAAEEGALELVRFQIKRAQSEILYIRINCWLAYAALILMAAAFWLFFDRLEILDTDRIVKFSVLMGFMVAVIFLFPFVTRPFVRRRVELIEKLKQIECQLQDEKPACDDGN